jgi:hypothetical protein
MRPAMVAGWRFRESAAVGRLCLFNLSYGISLGYAFGYNTRVYNLANWSRIFDTTTSIRKIYAAHSIPTPAADSAPDHVAARRLRTQRQTDDTDSGNPPSSETAVVTWVIDINVIFAQATAECGYN